MTQKQKKATRKESQEAAAQETTEVADITDVLDEIDTVLEKNAEEFVKGYVQKGGE